MFYWQTCDIDPKEILYIQELYRKNLPDNDIFYQKLNLGITNFLGHPVRAFVLIQCKPNALGNVHIDYAPIGQKRKNKLALQIPLENCEDSVTTMWESNVPPQRVRVTGYGHPYNFIDRNSCTPITKFTLSQPVIWNTDILHSADNYSDKIRRAISIRFEYEPTFLLGEHSL